MGLASAAGVAVDAEVVKLLGGEVEDGSLIGLFDGGEVEGVACSQVEGEAAGDAPVILKEVFLDLVAWADLAGLEVDLEGVDLAEEEAGDSVAAVGNALLVGSGGGEGEGAGGVGGRDGVELVPAEVYAGAEGVAAVSEDDGVEELPDGGLKLGEGAGGGAELLESGEGEEGKCVVEGGVGGDAWDAQDGGGGIAEGGADNGVAAASVAHAEVVEDSRGEGVGFVDDGLLAEDVGEADDGSGADDGAGDGSAAVGKGGDGLFDVGEVGVTAEGAVVHAEGDVYAGVELILMVDIVGGAGVVVGGGGEVGGGRESGEESYGGGVEGGVDGVVREFGANIDAVDYCGGGGVVDFGDAGEDSLALVKSRDGGDQGAADVGLDALVVAEEEDLVVDDGQADGATVEVAAVLGFTGGWGGGEVIASVEVFVAEELEEAAMDGVGAGAGGYVDDPAVEAAELGGDVVGLDGELFDAVDDGEVDDLAGFGLEGGDAVVDVFVGAGAAAVDAGKEGAGGKFDSGSQGRELDEVAGVEGAGDDAGAGDVGLDVAGGCLE